MKVQINFDSNDFSEIVVFRNKIVDLLREIDSYLDSNSVEEDCEECDCDCDEEECPGRCCKCDKDTECDNTLNETFVSDAHDGYVAEFINEAKDKCGFCKEFVFDNKFAIDCIEYGFFKTYSDVDKFIKVFADAKVRSDDNERRKNIVEKLIKAGVTEAFARHVVEHGVSIDPAKIPTEYSDEEFKKLMEYLRIKEDFEKQKANEETRALKEYLERQIIKISKTDRLFAAMMKEYFDRFKPTKISDVDKGIETIKKIFDEPNESENESEKVVDVKFEENEIRKGYAKRASDHFKKRCDDKKSDKTK